MQEVITRDRHLEDYYGLVPEEILAEIEWLANRAKGLRVIHINATPHGGGVAEILDSLIPLCRSAGIDASWYVISPDETFN